MVMMNTLERFDFRVANGIMFFVMLALIMYHVMFSGMMVTDNNYLSHSTSGEVNKRGNGIHALDRLVNNTESQIGENDPAANPEEQNIISTIDATASMMFVDARRQRHVVNYLLEGEKFIDIITNCIIDRFCHIHYLHTQKTGGTTIENKFKKILNMKEKLKSCCWEKTIKRYAEDRTERCMRPFNSYQVYASDFYKIMLKGCRKVYQKEMKKGNESRRIVALASFREPYEKTLSQIHQYCNKNSKRRTKEFLAMCKRCDYNEDQAEWDREIVDVTNHEYLSLHDDLILGTAGIDIPVLTIDTLDISSFFDDLKENLPTKYASRLRDEDSFYNQERLKVCDFGFRSAMMKNLHPSLEAYRDLTLGW